MSIRVLLRDYPNRAIALVTPSHALIFRHSPSTADLVNNGSLTSIHSAQPRTSTDGQSVPRCMVEFSALSSVDLSDYRTMTPRPIYGTLGLITINHDVFICVVAGASKVASVRPNETVEKIFAVEFYCLNSSAYDNVLADSIDPYSFDASRSDDITYGQTAARREPLEHPCAELQKLLGNGSFYYSTDFDLTNRLQDRSVETASFDIENLDESFLWNFFMISPLVKFRSQLGIREREDLDASRILTSAIRGFVLTITIPMSSAPIRSSRSGLPSALTLISRLSCRRAGTRFNSRGIDDDGNVANFVETETIFFSPAGVTFSYVQVRGSIPVFWEQQPGLIPGQQKITITRSQEGMLPAFDKHFQDLEKSYGAVHVINLLSETKAGEAELTELYRYGVRHSAVNQTAGSADRHMLKETEFDFHAETKGPEGFAAADSIKSLIEQSADGFAYYLAQEIEDPPDDSHRDEKSTRRAVVVLQQEGVFRTNCLDCLDRTNLVQTIISLMALDSFLGHRGEKLGNDFVMRHSSLWADNGDALSKIYAGTGALKSSFTRHGKMSFAGAIADARKSATRLYINNFADKGRQNTMDVLLGRLVGQTPVHLYDPINDHVTAEMTKRSNEYTTSEVINLWVGTYNLNGRTNGIDEDLSEWLFPGGDVSQQPEIFVVGFQEIVELNPQQIMNSDPSKLRQWEKAIIRCLNKHAKKAGSDHYVLLRSGQLVGACLSIYVKMSVLHHIKNVEGSVKKTGMSGIAGNKGAVAIRMEYANTQICFVTAHLAAGFANYDERNKDYHTIYQGIRFQRNIAIDNHDTVIWLGDFNYRIGMSSEKVRSLIKMGDLDTLYNNDQLNIQMVAGLTFRHYAESRITFLPTYKFDVGSDEYDTSEKNRIPAWTDRILRKGNNIRQMSYYSAPLRFSDHRPVYATFQCTVSIVDEKIRDALSRKIFEKRKADIGGTTANSRADDTDDEDLIGYDSIEPGLPPASSDRRKWWLENSMPARSNLQPPQKGMIPNPSRPANPWTPSDEPEWITVPRVQPTRTESDQSTASSKAPSIRTQPASSSNLFSSPRKVPPVSSSPDINPPLPARQPSTSSQTSTLSKNKAAPPPVAKKPTHLVSNSPSPESPYRKPFNMNGNGPSTGLRPDSVVSNSSNSSLPIRGAPPRNDASPARDVPPPKPRRPGTSLVASKDDQAGPRLPPRPDMDLLGDGDDRLQGWEVLKSSS